MKVKIIQKGNKILRQKAKEVDLDEIKGKKIKNILKRMKTALENSENGVALAAPQIGESLRIFIVDGNIWSGRLGEKEKKLPPAVFINPEIKKISRKKMEFDEGCLSIKNVYGIIRRAEKLTVQALDKDGKKFLRGVSGLLAQIIQHETDHLDGILFTDKAIKLQKYEE